MSDTPIAETAPATSIPPTAQELPPTSQDGGLSLQQHRDSYQFLIDRGFMSKDVAEQKMREAGNELPLVGFAAPEPKSVAGKLEGDVASLPGFEPGRVQDYQLPNLNDLHHLADGQNGEKLPDLTGKETMELQQRYGGWMEAAKLPPAIGSAVAKIAAKHIADMPRYAAMENGAQEAYRLGQMGKLQKLWGDKTGENIALARQLVNEIEAKRPGIKEFFDKSGIGSNADTIAQLATHARRLQAQRG
jgi:hypothetical protein